MPASEYDLRRAGPSDLDAFLTLRASQGYRRPGPATTRESETWATMMRTPGFSVYLAFDGDKVVGTASSILMPHLTYDCAPTLFIEAVSVLPAHRRRGIATALLNQCLADAADRGADKVQLLSHKRHADDGAHTLYTSVGFEAEAEGFRLYLRSGELEA